MQMIQAYLEHEIVNETINDRANNDTSAKLVFTF